MHLAEQLLMPYFPPTKYYYHWTYFGAIKRLDIYNNNYVICVVYFDDMYDRIQDSLTIVDKIYKIADPGFDPEELINDITLFDLMNNDDYSYCPHIAIITNGNI